MEEIYWLDLLSTILEVDPLIKLASWLSNQFPNQLYLQGLYNFILFLLFWKTNLFLFRLLYLFHLWSLLLFVTGLLRYDWFCYGCYFRKLQYLSLALYHLHNYCFRCLLFAFTFLAPWTLRTRTWGL